MTNQIIIDEIREDEKEQVRNLLVKSYQQYEHSYKDPEIWKMYLENIQASVDNPDVNKILVAKSNQDILGSLQLFQSSEKAYARPELEIFSPIIRLLGVHPEARGRGVAQALLKASMAYAKEIGANSLYLHSSDRMYHAIRLYEWFGFKRDKSKEFKNQEILVKCFRLDL